MDSTTSDSLFHILRREFPSLAEHTIHSIIHLSRNDRNLCYDACRKAVANQAASSSVSPVDASVRRSPMMAPSDFGFVHEQNGCPPEWRKAVVDPGYDIRVAALTNPHSIANGSPPTKYNHLQASGATVAADYHSDRNRLILSSHRHSESDVFGSMQSTGLPSRSRSGGGHAILSAPQESLLRRSPPVNGLGQLKIETGEDADIDNSWTQAMAADGTQHASAFQSPVLQPSSGGTPPQLLRYASELPTRQTSGARNAISEEVLAQILVAQQRSNLEKLLQTTATTESRLSQLLIEEARLADEIRDVKKRKRADGGGVLGSSTARELDKLKMENERLRSEVFSLQKQADALAAVAPLIRASSSGGGSLQTAAVQPAPPPYGGLQRGFPVPTTSSIPATQGVVTAPPPYGGLQRGYPVPTTSSIPATQGVVTYAQGVPISPPPVPPRPRSDGQPPRVSPRTTQPSSFAGQLVGHTPSQSQQLQQVRQDPRAGLVPRPPTATHAPVQHLVLADEGENWSCSACTFLNHPTLSTCEICDTPRM